MSTPANAELQKTSLNAKHRRMGAKMVDFGGWDMPVEYTGILAEHLAVRAHVGLFDVSHMGEIEIRGERALELVQYVTCNDASKLAVGQAHYSGLMTAKGTFVDDLLVHKFSDTHYFLCVNASNQDKDYGHMVEHNKFGAEVENAGGRYAQLAIQGPRALELLQKFTSVQLAPIQYYWFTSGEVDGVECIIARTGYTGEDGFEIYFAPEFAEKIWDHLMDAGQRLGVMACGLGARNTLRLEAGMALYGHEIDDTTTPWEANLGWICKVGKGEFLGREKLLKQKGIGVARTLAGFEMESKLIARDGYSVLEGERAIGTVTSGGPAPFLKKNIGFAYVPPEVNKPGTKIGVAVRSQMAAAKIVSVPFYKRQK
ncbi:MAG TPA: glycine cleavage system aminomethyltransferase GcvT [Candidatus Acidoferrales bacterium]|nr:glycine cleavage system aminomethyltransferase GcvT [Candidatus Acidoferrales bacterium]